MAELKRWAKKMKHATLALFLFFVVRVCCVAANQGEEIEFRFQPSFREGLLVWLARLPDGKLHCSAYILPRAQDEEVGGRSKAGVKLLKEVTVSPKDFQSLVTAFESEALRSEAESQPSSGLDGTSWVFTRKAGGRTVELRFWSPEFRRSVLALALGERFVSIACVQDVLPKEEPNQASEPTAAAGRGSP